MGRVVFQCFSVITARCSPIFRRHFPVLRRHFIICHAGVADVPCRRGRRAVPAWQTCRAGVADNKVPCTNGKISRKNGCAPCRNGGWASRSVRTLPGGRRTAGGDGEHAGHWGCYGRGAPFTRQRAAAHLAKIYQQGRKGAFEAAKMKFKACKCKSGIWVDACTAVSFLFLGRMRGQPSTRSCSKMEN